MTLTYGGVPLVATTQEIRNEIESKISLSDVYQWTLRYHPTHEDSQWTMDGHDPEAPIKLNTYTHPTHASRWGIGYFLVTSTELEKIRRRAYPSTESDRYKSLPLVIGAGDYKITTDLFMLPARPLFQIDGFEQLYLLVLVDKRWYWWEKSAAITVTEGATTWATLISSIATALGETITTDTIDSDYLKPSAAFQDYYGHLPLLLDGILTSIGHVLVVKLDGTVVTQQATTARTSEDSQITTWAKHAGGTFDLR